MYCLFQNTQFGMSLLFSELIHTQQEVKLFGPAFSSPAIWSVIFQVLHFQSPRIFMYYTATAVAAAKFSSVILHPVFSHQSRISWLLLVPLIQLNHSICLCFEAGLMWFRGDAEGQLPRVVGCMDGTAGPGWPVDARSAALPSRFFTSRIHTQQTRPVTATADQFVSRRTRAATTSPVQE